MKRDLDLIRLVLLQCESENPLPDLSGYTDREVHYHCALAIGAGLLQGQVVEDGTGCIHEAIPQRLTWQGHDFLDLARDQSLWNQAKKKLLQTGQSWTFEIVKSLLSELLKKALLP